jgi:hypothetical protein
MVIVVRTFRVFFLLVGISWVFGAYVIHQSNILKISLECIRHAYDVWRHASSDIPKKSEARNLYD